MNVNAGVNVKVINHMMLQNILDYENFKCRKKLVDKLVEECTENTDEVKMIKITLAEHECKFSCTLDIALISVIFTINIGIGTFFVYYKPTNTWIMIKRHFLKKALYFKQQFTKQINGKYQISNK